MFTALPCGAKCKYDLASAAFATTLTGKSPSSADHLNAFWDVTIQSDSEVEIKNRKTGQTCRAKIDQVIDRYWASSDTLVFESGSAVHSYLTFVRGSECKIIKSVDLPINNEKKRNKLMASLQICK
jgi:hypothetical protein